MIDRLLAEDVMMKGKKAGTSNRQKSLETCKVIDSCANHLMSCDWAAPVTRKK